MDRRERRLLANVGVFSFAMMAYSMFLVSPEDWEWLRDRLRARRTEDDAAVLALTLPSSDGPPAPSRRPLRWVAHAVLAVLVVAATSQVAAENPAISRFVKHEQPKWIRATVMTFRLNQGWKMFASNAPRHDMWLVVDAVTADGRHIDPLNEVASRYADPSLRTLRPYLAQNYYWYAYTMRIKGYRKYHKGLSDWIFSHHERTGNPDDRVVSFRVYEVSHFPPGPWDDAPRDVKAKVILSKRL